MGTDKIGKLFFNEENTLARPRKNCKQWFVNKLSARTALQDLPNVFFQQKLIARRAIQKLQIVIVQQDVQIAT